MDPYENRADLDKLGAAASSSAKDQQPSEDVQRPDPDEVTDPIQGAKAFQIFTIGADCEELVNSSNYSQAVEHLSRLHNLQPNHIKTLLMLAKCYFYMDKYDDCFEVIKKIRGVFLKEPRPVTYHMIVLSEKCQLSKERFIALVLLWCCCSIYKANQPDGDYKRICEYVTKMDDINVHSADRKPEDRSMTRRLSTISSRMANDIDNLTEGVETSDSDIRVGILLTCLRCKAHCCSGDVSRCNEATELFNGFVKQLEQPSSVASTRLSYGGAMASIAFLHAENREYDEAESACIKARSILSLMESGSVSELAAREHLLECIETELKEVRARARPDELGDELKQPGEGEEVEQQTSRSPKEGKLSRILRIFRKGTST